MGVVSTPAMSCIPVHGVQLSGLELTTPVSIDALHKHIAETTGIIDVYCQMTWAFSDRFKTTYGQAEFDDGYGNRVWHIKYTRKRWLLLSTQERKNLITHEMCHLAVERLIGYSKKVLSHGPQWQNLMRLCGEDPHMIYWDELRGSTDEDILFLSELLTKQHDTRTT